MKGYETQSRWISVKKDPLNEDSAILDLSQDVIQSTYANLNQSLDRQPLDKSLSRSTLVNRQMIIRNVEKKK